MTTMILLGAAGLIAFFWVMAILFQVNQHEDEMDNWDAINYRHYMNSQGSNFGQQNPMFWGQMFHPYEVMKQAYEIEERRRTGNIKHILVVIVLVAVCVAGTYILKSLGAI